MGERSDTSILLQLMDISLLCSLREGFSNVILESMAAGKPVIASRVGGNPEAVADGQTGYLFDPLDSRELAAKIVLLLRDSALREQMGRAAREKALEQFSNKKMVETYQRLYQSLLMGKL